MSSEQVLADAGRKAISFTVRVGEHDWTVIIHNEIEPAQFNAFDRTIALSRMSPAEALTEGLLLAVRIEAGIPAAE